MRINSCFCHEHIEFLLYQFYLPFPFAICSFSICTFHLNVLILSQHKQRWSWGFCHWVTAWCSTFVKLKPSASHRHYSNDSGHFKLWFEGVRGTEGTRKADDQDNKLERLRNVGNVPIIRFSHVTKSQPDQKTTQKSAVEIFRNFVCQKSDEERSEKMLR